MATDYKKINIKSRINLSSIREQRGDKTHFIYELIQNADDSKSKRLELHLCEKELLVWNDGCKFREEDVLRISSIGFSDKDLTQIGNFGTGFKAVYNYTDRPEVYSGDERFCLPDPTGVSKTLADLASSSLIEGIDKVPPRIAELVEEGRTVFRLPFKENLRPEDLMLLKGQLRKLLKKRSLLFLPHLETIQWYDICDEQTGTYCRYPYGRIQSADQVELKASMSGKDPEFERFLVFSKKFQPRRDVIDELLQMEHDEKRQERIQETAEKPQPIEIAFKLQDGGITAMNNCVLFAYLPTEKETRLRFFIQARYQTNPARNDIEKTEQNPWNRWLVEETAKFLPEVLEELKKAGLLEPTFFNVLPLDGEVENDFKSIADASRDAMKNRSLVPTQDGGYAKAENVFYPESTRLRKLVKSSGMYPDSSLLHSDIQNNEKSRRCFKVMREAGVEVIGVSQVLGWLEGRSVNWFEARSNEWLCSLYAYLKEQKSLLERIKKLPLVRLENEEHVCTSDQLAYFPPDKDEEREEIEPFLNELPILQSALLEAEDHNDVKPFLRDLGVENLHPDNLINELIFPLYRKSDKPSAMENRLHVRYIFKVWDKLSGYEHRNLREEISKISILRAYNGIRPGIYNFIKPCNAYLSKTYTGDANLETYFSIYNGEVWFVDDTYLEVDSNRKKWIQFLKGIKATDMPRVTEKEIHRNPENYQEFVKKLEERAINQQHSTKEYIKDFYFHGLQEILAQISNYSEVSLSRGLWYLLIKAAEPLSPEKLRQSSESARDAFFQGTYHYYYYNWKKPVHFDATFYSQLKETAWIPDEQGNFHQPSELFAPTDSNRRVLGDSVAYLHPDFKVGRDNEIGRWLAEKLGVYLNANTNSVLNYLQTMSSTETSVEKVEPLYRFLARQDARPSEEFKEKSLIFTSNPEPSWWRTDEVFWKDESEVFKNNRGYLKVHYSETLKPFFIALGVSEQASQLDYARGIQEITTTEQDKEEEVRSRVRRLYRSLTRWQADQWKIIYDSRCWLGKKGSEWEFFSRNELVWDDHRYIADIFEGEVPFWTFDDLLELTKYLKIEGCSQAKVEFHPEGDKEKDTDLSMTVRNLRPYIHAFLNSHRLCEAPAEGKSADVLNPLSVCFVEELKTTYTLKEISLTSPNPRPSFLEVTNEEVTLWLALAADKDDYALLIGDALQDYFGVKDLGRFAEHLLTKKDRDKVLDNWKREGLRTELCVSLPQTDAKEGEKKRSEYIDQELPDEYRNGGTNAVMNGTDAEIPITNKTPETGDEDNDLVTDKSEIHPASDEGNDSRTGEPEIETPVDSETAEIDKSDDNSISGESKSHTNSASDITDINSRDTQSLTKIGSGVTQSVKGESESETPTINETPEMESGDNNSVTSRPSGTNRSGGHSLSTSTSRKSGGGGHGGHGGGGEGEEHENLKRNLANNPSQFGEELKLVEIEYRFGLGDRVDILLNDGSENPVTVEVETGFSSGTGRYVGVWQAVKYQHLAAMEHSLACEQVRSILAAPEIPDDVKAKCEELGIEPFEVPLQ